MDKSEVSGYLMQLISDKLRLFDVKAHEVDDHFDLVRSGLLDSMSFIDLVASLEDKFNVEIDFEKMAEDDAFTNIGRLTEIINDARNAG